jgi:predicted glycoside hydrolase/deacetylase ChbG (UPF0249 family)
VSARAARRLIVNADDFGLSVGVNEGIQEAAEAGVATSTTMMVNTPGFADAVRRAAGLRDGLSVGLHFNLTTGAPVAPASEVPSLVDGAGRFLPLAAFLRRALTGGVRPAEVRREADAQFARLRAAGVAPTHADSHRHVHAFPALRGAFAAAAAAAGVRAVRRPLEPLGARPANAAGLAKRALLAAAWAVPARGPRPVPGTASFRGIVLLGVPSFEADLLALLDALPEGTTELMVHPGRNDPSVVGWDTYVAERAVELAALLSAPVRERLGRGDIVLTRFGAA